MTPTDRFQILTSERHIAIYEKTNGFIKSAYNKYQSESNGNKLYWFGNISYCGKLCIQECLYLKQYCMDTFFIDIKDIIAVFEMDIDDLDKPMLYYFSFINDDEYVKFMMHSSCHDWRK